jgi:signal transduction histidine kinase
MEPEGTMTGEHLLIAVSDNGVGIPQREIDKIFQPFYQVKGQKVDEKPGMGIGLAVVKELVDLHNGEIRVESTEDVGSMFQVALPISQEF